RLTAVIPRKDLGFPPAGYELADGHAFSPYQGAQQAATLWECPMEARRWASYPPGAAWPSFGSVIESGSRISSSCASVRSVSRSATSLIVSPLSDAWCAIAAAA